MLEKIGIEEARWAAFVLVAGGLGERLGYKGIKVVSLPQHIFKTDLITLCVSFIYLFREVVHVAYS